MSFYRRVQERWGNLAQRSSGYRTADLRICLIAALLAVLTFILYAKVGSYEFIILDDPKYVAMNAQVRNGLTWNGLIWAFTSLTRSNWFPLTWISHMTDVELFGVDAGYHHLSNVVLHSLSTALLFLALYRMTGKPGRSAIAAALFGIHPLHVESVAWVAERKDVLSGLLFMLILLAYTRFSRQRSPGNYALVLLPLVLGLMAKPMLVTVPVVLFLVDVWPLGRTRMHRPADGSPWAPLPWRSLVLEKIPLLGLSLASSIVTIIAQSRTISSFDALPFHLRAANAVVSYVSYLAKAFWPFSLSVYYPYPTAIPWEHTLGAALVLLIVSLAVLLQIRRFPFLAVGWFWYVVMLLPVIGLIQVGRQAMADRYTYLPLIGLFLMTIWLASETGARSPARTRALAVITGLVLLSLCAISSLQIGHWRNGVTLFTHALSVTRENAQAEKGLAISLSQAGRNAEAIPHFLESLRMRYDDAETHRNLGYAFESIGRWEGTIHHLQEAVRLEPDDKLSRASLQYYRTLK